MCRGLLDGHNNPYSSAVASLGLDFEKVDQVAYADSKAWVFEGRFSELDLQDVRHLLTDRGHYVSSYGPFELWRGGRQLSSIAAVLIGGSVIVAGREDLVKEIARVMVGELPSALEDPAVQYALPKLKSGLRYRFLPGGSWPGGWVRSVNLDESGQTAVLIHQVVFNPKARFEGEYTVEEVLDALHGDGYSGGLFGDRYEFEKTIPAENGLSGLVQ